MKKIRSKRQFCTAVIATVLSIAGIVIAIFSEQSVRYAISAIIFFAPAAVNYYDSFTKKGFVEDIVSHTDERDHYIAMKSCQITVWIVNVIPKQPG